MDSCKKHLCDRHHIRWPVCNVGVVIIWSFFMLLHSRCYNWSPEWNHVCWAASALLAPAAASQWRPSHCKLQHWGRGLVLYTNCLAQTDNVAVRMCWAVCLVSSMDIKQEELNLPKNVWLQIHKYIYNIYIANIYKMMFTVLWKFENHSQVMSLGYGERWKWTSIRCLWFEAEISHCWHWQHHYASS